MSENKSMNEWLKDWDALQRQYFNAWSDLAQKAPFVQGAGMPPFPGVNPFAAGTANPFAVPPGIPPGLAGFAAFNPLSGAAPGQAPPAWQEGMAQWSRMLADAGKQSETAERLTESARAYVAMVQSLLGGAQAAGEAGTNPAQGWFDAARNGFGAAAGSGIPGFDPATNPFAKALRDVAGKGAQSFAELPAAFTPYFEQMRKEGMSWLQMPAFGLAREHQEHYQRTVLALAGYQRALRDYNGLMLKVSQRGNELFERKLAERSEPGRAIDSLKALYDLWVDAMEDAYAEIALSEEFSTVYGELANAQMRVRKQIQIEVERIGRELGMPTRTELDSLSKRVHDLRRELRDGAVATASGEWGAEIAALHEEIAMLKKSPAQTRAKASPIAEEATATQSIAQARNEAAPAKPLESAMQTPTPRSTRRAAKPRVPAAVVRPRAVAEKDGGGKANSFADAVAAMRRRVVGKPKMRTAAAQMNKPSKHDKKRGKKGGKKN